MKRLPNLRSTRDEEVETVWDPSLYKQREKIWKRYTCVLNLYSLYDLQYVPISQGYADCIISKLCVLINISKTQERGRG